MENLKINNYQHERNYINYKLDLEKFKEALKQNTKYEDLYKILDSTEKRDIYLIIYLFKNYYKCSNINYENINNETESISNNFLLYFNQVTKIFRQNDTTIKSLFYFIIHGIYFLYSDLISHLYSESPNSIEINKIRYLLKEIIFIIRNLFKTNILNSAHIIIILHLFMFLLDTNYNILMHSDKLYKLKNYILLEAMFSIFQEIFIIMLTKVSLDPIDDDKYINEIERLLNFLEEIKNNKEINYRHNIAIIINHNILGNLMNSIMKKITAKFIIKYEDKFKNKLVHFFSYFFKFNYSKSKIYNIFLESLKNSFINLYNFDSNKEKIIHDLFIQAFYMKLAKIIFVSEENSPNCNNSIPQFNSFFFNGYDSQISLKLQNNKLLEKSSLFFAFSIFPLDNKEVYPLFIIEKDFDKKNNKEIAFNIYLKKSESKDSKNNLQQYDLYIFKGDKEIKIDNIAKINSNTVYYCNITFFTNKVLINLYNGKGDINQVKIDKSNKFFDSNSFNLIFGFNKTEKSSFSGYIGPVIIIKNPTNTKEIELNDLIALVLKLQKNYKYFLFFETNSSYSFEYLNHFQNNNALNKFKKKFEKINNFECYLYLTPDILNSLIEVVGAKTNLPDIGIICPNQKNYVINNLNVTLVKYELGIVEFAMNNGLDYICLLYEYIYQFMENYNENDNNAFIKDKDYIFKLISSVFKKTLYILKNIYSEINIKNFNKNLKQIFMNLISCIKLISKKYIIIDSIINYFFNIIINYCSYIFDLINNIRKMHLNDVEADIINENKELLQINLSFLSGWIDFILTPELYDFNNTQTLINLFDKISSYFNFQGEKEAEVILNQHFYLKLLSFTNSLNSYFEQFTVNIGKNDIVLENSNNTLNNNIDNSIELEDKKEVLNCYLKAIKSFFENNPSKSENILNLRNIFKYINEKLGNNYQICTSYYNFIKELLGSNPDFFCDENDDQQIKALILYISRYMNTFSSEIKDENTIINKNNAFNKLISILMKIIFTKKRTNKNTEIVSLFKKIIQNVPITSELIITITDEIKDIIDYYMGASKNSKIKKISFDKNDKSKKNYTLEELKYISKFYSEIFNLILYFLEYPVSKKNINNIINIDIYEEKLLDLLELIEMMIKANIENSKNIYYEDKKEIIFNHNDYNDVFTIDTIYCLINFLKFYYIILFKKLYPEKYIISFINVCKLCSKSCLINSNILIEFKDSSSKTILEIILDICMNYIIKSCKHFYQPLKAEELNNLKKENIINEQVLICDYLTELFPKINNQSKEVKKRYTIFFNNDYIRLISENFSNENIKNLKKDSKYSEYKKEFSNYRIINNFLLNEQKFIYNFSTFFLIKVYGYTKLLLEINSVINNFPQIKVLLKYNELLYLFVNIKEDILNENKALYEANKDFFFKSKKANSSSYPYYTEIKKRIEYSIMKKKKNEGIEQYLEQIFSNENVFLNIFSGQCKRDSKSFSFSIFPGHKRSDDQITIKNNTEKKKGEIYKGRLAFSSTNLMNLEGEENKFKTPIPLLKKHSNNININSLELNSSSWGNNNKSQLSQDDDEDYELCLKEDTPSSESQSFLNNLEQIDSINNINNNSLKTTSPPILHQRAKGRQKTVNSSKVLFQNFDIFEKRKTERERTISIPLKDKNNNNTLIDYKDDTNYVTPYINFFDEPDEYYLKNAKKLFMMNVFSLFFFDSFFYSDNFKNLKNYYFQQFEGVQPSTKELDFPSKIKNYSNGLEPSPFLKPYTLFFDTKIFPICQKYFYDYMVKNKIFPEPIVLYQKSLPELILEEQFDQKCELIKVDHNYYGHIIGSKKHNFIIFEEQEYKFYQVKEELVKQKHITSSDLNDLFSLTFISKRPLDSNLEKIINRIEKNIFNKNKKTREKKILIILLNEIEEIIERRFLLMWQAVEIYLKNGKSYFFNFLNKEKCKSFLEMLKKNCNFNLSDKIHEKDYFKNQKYITSQWAEERLSTYEYLLYINKYSSRSFNDPNQYPIFPWLISFNNNSEIKENYIYRNLKYPMAVQTEENQITSTNRYQDEEDNHCKFPAHFGTHYSTSAYVYFYLMREEPFTTLLVKLQGYKQENPDRMFYSINEILSVLDTGHDNRELIPELYFKIEQFINLNCVDFGIKITKVRVDDFIIIENNKTKKGKKENKELYKYVKFIIDNKKLLNKMEISGNINDWIDNIFGIGQLPEKNRKKSLNIFYKETYEQKTDLQKKLKKLLKKHKNDMSTEDIIKKITNKIDLIVSFGQTPYQLFNDKHPKYGKKALIEGEEDFEFALYNEAWNKEIKTQIEMEPLFFTINYSLGKIFLIDNERRLEIVDSTLFEQKGNEKYEFTEYSKIQLSHIKFFEKICIKEDKFVYYIIKQKYCISPFDENLNYDSNQLFIPKESEKKIKLFSSKDLTKINLFADNKANTNSNEKENNNNNINFSDCNDNEYTSYYNTLLKKLKYEHLKLNSRKYRKTSKDEEYFRFITCRYEDNTFKIYNIPKNKDSFKKEEYIPMSFVCENFVTSCCTISPNKFLVGLKNGKLLQWSIEESNQDIGKNQNQKKKLKVKFNKQIQAHKNSINVIEINHRLGIIITAGYDNYVFIRKLYDLELLIPIKFKSKYIITMAKVSPMNFLYIMCFNKNKKKSCIFGYTLNGLCFGKSSYDFYDTLDFTKNGNIVTWIHKKHLDILHGDSLKRINTNGKDNDSVQFNNNQKKLSGSSWVKFIYFYRKNEEISNVKIILYINDEKNKRKNIMTLDVSKIRFFD